MKERKEVAGFPKDVIIECPDCEWRQLAQIHFYDGDPLETYIHECSQCGYVIGESEWSEI